MSEPAWNSRNLQRHYQKHPNSPAERDCWKTVTGEAYSPISLQRYEEESKAVTRNAWLVVDAGHQETLDNEPQPVRNYYDSRCCFTAVSLPRNTIRTCFHFHFHNSCVTEKSLHTKIKLLKRCISKKQARKGRMTSPKVIECSVPPNERKRLETFLTELRAPVREQRST
jgi:hypothetical protein